MIDACESATVYRCPPASVLKAFRNQNITWFDCLAELVDNAIDAGARNIAVTCKSRKVQVADDGIGSGDPLLFVVPGDREEHGITDDGIGEYGVGAKDAIYVLADAVEIVTTTAVADDHHRKTLRLNILQKLKESEWNWPCPVAESVDENTGTRITLTLRPEKRIPDINRLSSELSRRFTPAIENGVCISLHRHKPIRLQPVTLPSMSHVVKDKFEVDGRSVEIEIGLVDRGQRCIGGFYLQYTHRYINVSAIGTGKYNASRLAGVIKLSKQWGVEKNKTSVIDGQRQALADAVFERIVHLLEMDSTSSFEIHCDELLQTIGHNLMSVTGCKEKRPGRTGSVGTQEPSGSGRKRRRAAVVDALESGSVDGGGRSRERPSEIHGATPKWYDEDGGDFGKFDVNAGCVQLNRLHPVIAECIASRDERALTWLAMVVMSYQHSSADGKQRVFKFKNEPFLRTLSRALTIAKGV